MRSRMSVRRTTILLCSFPPLPNRQNPLFVSGQSHFQMVLRTSWPCGSNEKTTLYLFDSGMENVRCNLFEKTKIGSARRHAASRPNLLETPAGHEVFVKRRYNFAPARRRPIDQLDGGRQLDPEGSREKKEFQNWSN